jgi:hypothetical protein
LVCNRGDHAISQDEKSSSHEQGNSGEMSPPAAIKKRKKVRWRSCQKYEATDAVCHESTFADDIDSKRSHKEEDIPREKESE